MVKIVKEGQDIKLVVEPEFNVDVLQTIAQEILKGNPKRTETIKETLEKSPSIEEMKEELEKYNELAKILSKKIKEEERRDNKKTNHLIEKKVRIIRGDEYILFGTDREEYKTNPKEFRNKETLTYRRNGNSIKCVITNSLGRFTGVATRHEEDEFDYESGMTLARVRAMKNMYNKLESDLVNTL